MNRNSRLKDASGHIQSDDPLITFIYLLVKDHIPFNKIEELLKQSLDQDAVIFVNGWLAEYAQNVASELRRESWVELDIVPELISDEDIIGEQTDDGTRTAIEQLKNTEQMSEAEAEKLLEEWSEFNGRTSKSENEDL